jgi:hypothetical protein
MIILDCKSNLNQLDAADIILMDGTFGHCPKFFGQVFAIHCATNGHYMPLVFLLAGEQTRGHLHNFFVKISKKLRKFLP